MINEIWFVNNEATRFDLLMRLTYQLFNLRKDSSIILLRGNAKCDVIDKKTSVPKIYLMTK